MGDSVFGSERRLCEVGVAELNGVQELLALDALQDYREGVVVIQGGTNIEVILSMKVPRCMFVGFGMNENTAVMGTMGVAS